MLFNMSNDEGQEQRRERFGAAYQRHLEEFDARLTAGDFELGLQLSTLTGKEGVEQQRQAFAFAAWAARVSCDPGEDFDGFVECLWQSVEGLFQLGERVGADEDADLGDLPESMRSPEDPSVVVWGDE